MKGTAAPKGPIERGGRGESRGYATCDSSTAAPMVALGACCRVVNGTTPAAGDDSHWKGDIAWITPTDLGKMDGMYINGSARTISRNALDSHNLTLCPPGSVVLSSRAPIGHLGIAAVPLCTNQGCKTLVPRDGVKPAYLYYALLRAVPDLKALGSGATFAEVSKAQVEAFEIPLPPLAEQERIAGWVSRGMERASAARRAALDRLAAAEALPAALLREVFEGPEASAWETRTLGEFAKTCSGATPPRSNAAYFGGGIPWVKTGELRDGFVGDDGSTDESVTEAALRDCSLPLLPPGTLLIAMYGQGKTRGRTGILTREATTNQACFAILPEPVVFDTTFVQLWFRANYNDLRTLTENRGGNQPNLNGVLLRELEIPLPDPATQRRLAAELTQRLAASEAVIARCREELAAIEALPAALLRQAFRGND